MSGATEHWLQSPALAPYRTAMLAGMALSAWMWWRRTRHQPRLFLIWVGALGGVFVGAKLAYLFSEAATDWARPDRWLRLATGKSILGGLLGGWAGVEIAKALAGYRRSTGDRFAVIAPLAVGIGRIGCCLHGCCQGRIVARSTWCTVTDPAGQPRWPSAQWELAFQIVAAVFFSAALRAGWWRDRLFFLYLAAYGLFRMLHEPLRDTPTLIGDWSGYRILGALCVLLGTGLFARRTARMKRLPSPTDGNDVTP